MNIVVVRLDLETRKMDADNKSRNEALMRKFAGFPATTLTDAAKDYGRSRAPEYLESVMVKLEVSKAKHFEKRGDLEQARNSWLEANRINAARKAVFPDAPDYSAVPETTPAKAPTPAAPETKNPAGWEIPGVDEERLRFYSAMGHIQHKLGFANGFDRVMYKNRYGHFPVGFIGNHVANSAAWDAFLVSRIAFLDKQGSTEKANTARTELAALRADHEARAEMDRKSDIAWKKCLARRAALRAVRR